MNRIQEAALYGRFAFGLRPFLRRRMALDEALGVVSDRLLTREAALATTLR